jgi:hypothetical protein
MQMYHVMLVLASRATWARALVTATSLLPTPRPLSQFTLNSCPLLLPHSYSLSFSSSSSLSPSLSPPASRLSTSACELESLLGVSLASDFLARFPKLFPQRQLAPHPVRNPISSPHPPPRTSPSARIASHFLPYARPTPRPGSPCRSAAASAASALTTTPSPRASVDSVPQTQTTTLLLVSRYFSFSPATVQALSRPQCAHLRRASVAIRRTLSNSPFRVRLWLLHRQQRLR